MRQKNGRVVKYLKTSVYLLSIAIIAVPSVLTPSVGLAASGQIYLAPATDSIQIGNTFTLALRINPGTAVNAVQATVSYDQNALEFISSSIGVFSTCVSNSGGGGSVTLACAMLGTSTSSDSLIDNITFKALSGSGNTTLNLINANASNAGSWTNPSSSGATIDLTSPPPPPPSNPAPVATSTPSKTITHISAPVTSTSSGGTVTPPPAPVVVPEAPTNVKLNVVSQNVNYTNATIAIKATASVQLSLKYGLSPQTLDKTAPLTVTGQTAQLNFGSLSLTPGTTYYYQVVASFNGSTLTATPVRTITTKGYTVQVTVLDSNYLPLVDKKVSLHSAAPIYAYTNAEGVATFSNVAPGSHELDYTSGDHSYVKGVYVPDNLTVIHGSEVAPIQSSAVVLSGYRQPSFRSSWTYSIILAMVAALCGGLFTYYRKAFRRLFAFMWRKIKRHRGVLPIINRPIG